MAYPRNRNLRRDIFVFFRLFARLTAYFVESDLKELRHGSPDDDYVPDLISPGYINALALLTRKEESNLHATQLNIGETTWSYAQEAAEILAAFKNYHANQGTSLAFLMKLGQLETEIIPRFPKVIEGLGMLCCLTSNICRESFRKTQDLAGYPHHEIEQAKSDISRGYQFFIVMSTTLSTVIDRYVNHLSHESALNQLSALAEIYQICLSTEQVVPSAVVQEHCESHLPVAAEHVAEAIACDWRLNMYCKLIMSSQMQLRVMAASSMCAELVNYWGRFSEASDNAGPAFLSHMADSLLRTPLVRYILGPTCHPEITLESGNIIGFLLVSRTYNNTHTDLMWQTVNSSKDPRVSDALIRMTSRITNLYTYEGLIYLCEKLNGVAVEAFGPTMRDFLDQILRALPAKIPYDNAVFDLPPYLLCVRLIKESSVFGSQSRVAHPEVMSFAIQKFRELLSHGPSTDGRWRIYNSCLEDIAAKSPTSLGSLCVISNLLRPFLARDLPSLTLEHDLTRLLIDEFEAAIPMNRAAGFPAVLSGAHNGPRKDLVLAVIMHQPSTITKDLGARFWEMLVGTAAPCREDREVGWNILNQVLRRQGDPNPFLSTCFSEYMPKLPPDCFCAGTLEFVRDCVRPLVNDPNSIILDDEDDSSGRGGIEQLWRISLTTPPGTIENQAISCLVREVYIASKSILAFPHHRARRVHLSVVDRCLKQLSSAAAKLRAYTDASSGGNEELMGIVAAERQVQEEELLFVRSLSILREFHRLHLETPKFSAPDLRSLIMESPSVNIQGDPADLKFQSFDGERQTEIRPLNIGKLNTAASLLASLREATGFSNYRMYYRGRPFVPRETDICKSLEDLQIHQGIILVKREAEGEGLPARVRPGASAVEAEILSHFDDLWSYLTMEEKLAYEIYSFLVKLPSDETLLRAIESAEAPHHDIFIPGQPFKSLYAIHVLEEHLASQRQALSAQRRDDDLSGYEEDSVAKYLGFLGRAMQLVVSAISDPDIIERIPGSDLRINLGSAVMDCFVCILRDRLLPASTCKLLDGMLAKRLVRILSLTVAKDSSDSATRYICLCLQAIFECCSKNPDFWMAFCSDEDVPSLVTALLLDETRPAARRHIAELIAQKVGSGDSTFSEFFWPLASGLVRPAMLRPRTSDEAFSLVTSMLKVLRDIEAPIIDVKQLLLEWGDLLLTYTSYEDVTQPDTVDVVANGLVRLLHCLLCSEEHALSPESLPGPGFARKLFWKHLFPPFEQSRTVGTVQPIVTSMTRGMLIDIIIALTRDDAAQFRRLIDDLDELVPFFHDDEGGCYAYELLQQFERSKAIRAPCGYVGLKNLSNTCYFNSLFTQLFMNTDFRRFILNAPIQDPDYSQALLFQTQKLFAFLQESIRRYISPDDCVASIKTYEDMQIDIHSQMDVDEFYNLLFDRWEGQLSSAEAKRQFRTFYGGQLVQQVASKECDHISERLEPFSAIQCDIKGKTSLEQSLQAYVDGEIMEGDNKYKCSTCDRHVDAVKRACLKDIPDNLIFHLKRFDFNLRTLQRSKINDYFAFPSKIDMRPYTIEYLSNTIEDQLPDVFELVGVLVHSGTAESGHYYSYIRERPTSSNLQSWVEFNDDLVTPWDPAQMEASCFGGLDYRTPFDQDGIIYDKTYSAYMLFYQRSSALEKEQELLMQSKLSRPLHVPVFPDMKRHIELENTSLVRRHCLYDPGQIPFVHMILQHMRKINHNECSDDHKMEDAAIRMALSHLDQVASRTKDIPDFEGLVRHIAHFSPECPRCSYSIYNYYHERTDSLRFLVQRNAESFVRKATSELFTQVLKVIKANRPWRYGIIATSDGKKLNHDSVLNDVVNIFKYFIDYFHQSIRSWHEVFGLMLSFVRLGPHEKAAFLGQPFLRTLILIVSADSSLELSPQMTKMLLTVSRRMANRPPSYETIIDLLDELISAMSIPLDDQGDPILLDTAERRLLVDPETDGPFLFTRYEYKLIHQDWGRNQANIFVEKLIGINQNQAATNSILINLMRYSHAMEDKIFRTLKIAILAQPTGPINTPFLQVAARVFCRFSTQPDLIRKLIAHISQQCMCLQVPEGKAFFDFQREVFDGPREMSGESAEEVLIAGIENIPDWAPGLLGHFDPAVSADVETFLHERLFKFGPSPDFGDDDTQKRKSEAMDASARRLGIRCLAYLRDNYVARRVNVPVSLVSGLERVIRECRKYYTVEDIDQDTMTSEFYKLSQNVLEPLQRLTVEESEEDGAGVYYSDSSSITSSVTAA
ncbi:hypothetical protein VTK73DRAFT_9286 [Phialemonium thermophilum]|uniref:USP domain-containing protein n=1 Tax=Phialemonium thermophilum TaxID=223376 RepID=A0ABR3W388_9PEZI